jgi:hypothetical protein
MTMIFSYVKRVARRALPMMLTMQMVEQVNAELPFARMLPQSL